MRLRRRTLSLWDGGNDTSSPSNFGWTSSANRTLNARNASGGIRMTTNYSGYKLEDGTSYSYSATSDLSSVIFWVRYNTSGESFTYTFKGLEANYYYDFSALVGWHNNSDAPTFTVKINDGTSDLATMSKSVSTRQTLYSVSSRFKTPSTITNTTDIKIVFTCNKTGDCMEAISALSLVNVVLKDELQAALTYANRVNTALNNSTLASAITTAQDVYDDASATQAEVDSAIPTLKAAVATAISEDSPSDISWVLANPGFEGCTVTTTNAAATASAAPLDIAGDWTQSSSAAWSSSAVVAYDGAGQVNGASAPSTDDAGNSGNTLGVSVGWDGMVTYQSPAILLPAGVYTLKVNAYNANSDATQFTSKFGFVPTSGDATLSSKNSFTASTWETDEVTFTLNANTEGKIQVGGQAVSGGSGSNAKVFFDNITIGYENPLAGAITAWNNAHSALAALDATALPDAAETAITTELAKERPATQEEIVSASAALQALIDSYDGIKAAFDEYKALKAQVEDLKNTSKYTFTGTEALSTFNSTLSTIDTSAEGATDAATITALLPDLKAAGNTFVGAIDSNDGFDVTYNIVNNSFETGTLSPWTTNGSNDTGVKENSNGTYTTTGVDGSYLFNTWNNDAGSKVSQTLSSLPNGYYTVTALVASDAGNTINILAGATTKTVDADGTNGKTQFVEGTTDKTLVSDGSLEIGTNSSSWYKSDYFRLTYYTVKAGAAEAWAAAKAAAEAARDNAEYANVAGSEKTNLLAEIAKDEPTTAEAYGTATTALQEATSAFTAAKDSYDGLIAKRTEATAYTTVAWPYASTAKKTALNDAVEAVPTDAADAVTKTNAITTAIRQFVESNGVAEGVAVAVSYASAIEGADPDVNTGWTDGIGVDNRGNEKYTDGNGNVSGKYYDGGWSTSAGVNINMTRTLTLPAGQYLLQVTARGSENLTTYTMSVGGESVNLPKQGSGVNVGTFGHGWSDKYVVFTSDGTELTLTFAATSTEYQQWISFNRLRLTKLDATLATAEDYENLNNAIAAAEANLGFEDGQSAPYNNVASMELLVAAKAIDQTINNVQSDVQDATSALLSASWTANDGDVNAIYNGGFATVAEGQNYPDGWKRTNGWGQMQSGISGDYATAYYNQPGSLQYGNQGVYTMPLAANTIYKLEFAYRSHEDNSNTGVTVSVLNGEEGLANYTFPGNGSTSNWALVSKRFKTGTAGNYVLTLANGGNTWMTNVSLVKASADEITITEEAYADPAASDYANVTLARSFNAGWNAVCLPFATTAFDGAEIAEFTGDTGGDNVTLNFTKVDVFEANLVYFPSSVDAGKVFEGVAVAPAEVKVEGTAFDFMGTYIVKEIAANDWVVSGGKLMKASQTINLKPTRTYFTPKSPEARIARFTIDGVEASGISAIFTDEAKATDGIYNLQGQKVSGKMQKGIYIMNGKKVIK